MTCRTITIAAALALAFAGFSSPAEAGDPLKKFIRKVEKYVDNHAATYPTPLPFPKPFPQPCPQPWPEPAPQPWPEPTPLPGPYPTPEPAPVSYFLGVYTSTVAVNLPGAGPVSGGPQAYVVPGYGEQVYGQRVNQIVPNSPAFHAGLEPGDILVNANGVAMDSQEQLRDAIANSQGYLEMQVLDSRSGQLLWVVAETDPQNSVPMVASSSNLNAARQAFKTKTTQRTQFTNSGAPRGSFQTRTQPSTRQDSQAGVGGRRPPVRRR